MLQRNSGEYISVTDYGANNCLVLDPDTFAVVSKLQMMPEMAIHAFAVKFVSELDVICVSDGNC